MYKGGHKWNNGSIDYLEAIGNSRGEEDLRKLRQKEMKYPKALNLTDKIECKYKIYVDDAS